MREDTASSEQLAAGSFHGATTGSSSFSLPGKLHFFSVAGQLVTTMNGEGALAPSGAAYRNRLPSADDICQH